MSESYPGGADGASSRGRAGSEAFSQSSIPSSQKRGHPEHPSVRAKLTRKRGARSMSTSLPDPFVPPSTDLRDFPRMTIDIGRLFASEFHARPSDGEWRAGVTPWLKAIHPMPAGSLPDDGVALARLGGLGRGVSAWLAVEEGAPRGGERW